jgi:hypothetical protein
MTMLDFDDQVLALCDDLWSGGERLVASQLFLAAFTGFGTERAREMLMIWHLFGTIETWPSGCISIRGLPS